MSEALQHEIRHLRSLEGSPRDPDGRIFLPLADAHLRAGELDTAEELLVDGLARHPEFVAAHVMAARLREAQGNLDSAELAYAAARRLDPENAEVMYGLGRIMAGRGEEVGVALVEKARMLDPTAGHGVPRPAVQLADGAAQDEGGIPEDANVVAIAELAPEVADLASDQTDVVSIADLAPDDMDDAAHVDDPAPDESDVVSIADLAPTSFSASGAEGGLEPSGEFGSEAAPVAAVAEPAPSAGVDRRVVTRTLAELLVAQGQRAEAVDMYATLVERNPNDDDLRGRLDELRDGDEEGELDDEAHHPTAPEPTPDTPTPFAWTEERRNREPEEDDAPPVSLYFDELLAWSPKSGSHGDA